MGFFSKKKTTTTLEPMKEKWQLEAGQNLANFANTNMTQNPFVPGQEYGRISYLMSPSFYEQIGLDQLGQFQQQGKPAAFTAANEEMLKTLQGDYDPATSDYYQATRKNIEKERLKAIKDANNLMAKYGLNQSSYKTDRLSEINENTFDQVSTLLGTMAENERVRKLNAAPVAANIGNMENAMDLQKIQASQQFGSLPRLLEAVGYEDFLRQQQERQFPYQVGQQVFSTPIEYGQKSITTESPSTFSKFIGPAVQAAGFALAPFTGGASIPISQVVAPIATGVSGGDVSSSSMNGFLNTLAGSGGSMDFSKLLQMFGSGSAGSL